MSAVRRCTCPIRRFGSIGRSAATDGSMGPCGPAIHVILTSGHCEQEVDMQITRGTTQTAPGNSDWFTGSVFLDPIAAPSGASRLSAASVHFTPGARTAWHTHPHGQTLWVL